MIFQLLIIVVVFVPYYISDGIIIMVLWLNGYIGEI
jgi:hypothetical protein